MYLRVLCPADMSSAEKIEKMKASENAHAHTHSHGAAPPRQPRQLTVAASGHFTPANPR